MHLANDICMGDIHNHERAQITDEDMDNICPTSSDLAVTLLLSLLFKKIYRSETEKHHYTNNLGFVLT